MRVCGIAETDNENTSDIVVRVTKDMGVDISLEDMRFDHRVGGSRRGRSDRPRPILATFDERLHARSVVQTLLLNQHCENPGAEHKQTRSTHEGYRQEI